jgi:hypothetical protein
MLSIENHNDTETPEALVERIANESSRGCGCSDEVYTSKFSRAIDRAILAIDETKRQAVMEIARTKYDYLSREEERKRDNDNAAEGICCHGLDHMTCPCGCFED